MSGKRLKIKSLFINKQILPIKKLLALIIFIGLFFVRLQFVSQLDLQDGQLIRVRGTLTEEPQVSGNRQSLKMGQFEVWTEKFPEYHYGERVKITGRVKVIAARARLEESYLLSYPEIESSEATANKGITGLAIGLKNRLKEVYQQSLPSPLAGILAGIVLGDKSLIPYQFWQILKQTGTLHIMVASGMNIALFSGTVLSWLTLFSKRKPALIFLFIVIWFYSLMTGFQSPIVRAAIMASLVYICQFLGREAEGGRVLWLTGGIMLFFNPLWLWDLGFQLSFLATAGLVYVQPKLEKIRFWLFKSESFSSSLASQLSTLPILVLSFGQLNLISPLINLAVLWTVPLLLQGGMIVGGLGLGSLKLGQLAACLLYPLLFYLEKILNLLSEVKIFQYRFPRLDWWLAVVYYGFLIMILKGLPKSDHETIP